MYIEEGLALNNKYKVLDGIVIVLYMKAERNDERHNNNIYYNI